MPARPFIRTLRAQWLGQQLRELREQCGLTLRLVSDHLQRDLSALGRYERAEWPIRRGDVVSMLDLYGLHDAAERSRLLHLAEEVWRTDRWDEDFGDVVDASFIDFPWLESRAERVCSYHAMLVPGLLQTRAYAEAVIRNAEASATEDKIARWLELRMQRQRVLDGDRPTPVATIIDEAALRRRVGGAALLREQLEHLLAVAGRPAVELRVLPTTVGLHAGLDGSFLLFRMPPPYPAVAYVEYLGGRLYLEAPKSERYVRAYDRLREAALSPSESAALIATIVEEL